GLIGGSVVGTRGCCSTNADGGLVGLNGNGGGGLTAVVVNDYNTGTVSGGYGANVGGLVGYNMAYNSNATVQNSYATGAVSGGSDGGGLVGYNLGNNGTGTISDSYATGAVSSGYWVGGLLGFNNANGGNAVVSNVYSTGAISGASYASGGVIAYTAGTISHAYWDSATTGVSNGSGIPNGSTPTTSVTTAQLQSTATTGLTLGSAFAGGAAGGTNGVYPYLISFFPNGVQAISGTAYTGAANAPLVSGSSGAGVVSVASAGAIQGASTTGANGYYYVAMPAGTLAANQGVVAFTQFNAPTGAKDGSAFVQSSGSATSVNVYGGWRVDQPGSLASSSALNSAYATAIGSTAAAGLTLANREIDTTAAFVIDQSMSATGALVIAAGGEVTETGSATLTAADLRLTGSTNAFTLNNANQIGLLAASVGALSLNDATDLTTGSMQDAHGNPVVSGADSAGVLTLKSGGNLTLAANASGVSGVSPTLSAAGAFVNNAGANAVTATSGRWLIYSSSSSADTFGNLNSANTAIFNSNYSNLPPANVTQSGNRYLFANQPVLNITSTSDTKTYGVDNMTSITGDYTITGFPTGANAFVSDTVGSVISGAPSVTSSGSTAFAPVASGPYAIDVSTGTLAASGGYTMNFVSSGQLTVNPATITVAGATGVNKTYDTTTALLSGATGFTSSGVLSNDTGLVTVSAGNAMYAGANAGPENVNVSGLVLGGSAAGNYTLTSTTVTGSGTIAPAMINLRGTRTYDAGASAGAAVFLTGGVVAGISAETLTLSGSGTLAGKNVGNEAVTSLGTLALGNGTGLASNYTLVGGTDAVTVTPATITVAGAGGVNKTYDSTTALSNGAAGFTTSGVFSADASLVTVSAATDAYVGANAGPQNVSVSGLTLSGTAAGNYTLSSTGATGSGTIAPAVIDLSGTRTYDAGVSAGAAIFASAGTVAGISAETLTLSGSGTLAGKNAGNQTVNSLGTLTLANGTGLASNYTLVGGTDAVTVTPATITVAGASGVNKTYDATTALPLGATGFTTTGILSSDANALGVSAVTAAYTSAAVGNETVNVSGLTLSGTAAGNYRLSSTSVSGSGTISAANVAGGGVPPVAVVPTLPLTGLVAGGAGGFALSGSVLSSSTSANGLPMTITGSLSNGGTTISGTFIVQARPSSGTLPLGDQIAESSTDVVTYVPGTLTVRLAAGIAGVGLASTADRTASNEVGAPIDAMPYIRSTADDTARSWKTLDTFSSPGFDRAVACVKGQCAANSR
ncbi:MAG: filamentous hemagglutinin N-terminal protein, partial [Gammaproteobacteria bacterium]|nr:filamentous hemagglutinin N-terminal protein [Gammaproteobacteria bacterium]